MCTRSKSISLPEESFFFPNGRMTKARHRHLAAETQDVLQRHE